ncbi:MAG TPA: thioredoxin family protein [Aggregatilineales bacterium]|nr:thioredoxin family protein [Aggregatilineales bacterium]
MTPIVHGLEDEFSDQVAFLYFDVLDDTAGQEMFESLNLPGHPSFVLFDRDGREIYRAFGIVTDEALRSAIEAAVPDSVSMGEP